jgi:tRNA uridine 5-carboxymethylaminomethyl modification enzyme
LFTSRAEYRLILREDNATIRLMGRGHALGLIGDDAWRALQERVRWIETGIGRLKAAMVYPVAATNAVLEGLGQAPLRNPASLFDLLKRDALRFADLAAFPGWEPVTDRQVVRQIEIESRYEGYIRRQREAVEKMKDLERRKIPPELDYGAVPGLSNELKLKLSRVRPATIAQAERIPGMTQAALTAVLVAIRKAELAAATDRAGRDAKKGC